MIKVAIGIVSYLPDDKEIREVRTTKLFNLIRKCQEIFYNVPFIIIAQNYHTESKDILKVAPHSTIVSCQDKLGITGARKYLRNVFLNSEYDYLIMLDDDCTLSGDYNSGKLYLQQIEEHPGRFYEFNRTLLKLFAISKEIFSKEDYEDVSPEKAEGFEDRIFVNKLRKKYPDRQYTFIKHNLSESSISTKDTYSTWYTNQDLNKMLENTNEKIKNI